MGEEKEWGQGGCRVALIFFILTSVRENQKKISFSYAIKHIWLVDIN